MHIFLLGASLAVPWIAFALNTQFHGPVSPALANVLFFLFFIYSIIVLGLLWKESHTTFHSLANFVRAIRNGDYSQRAGTTTSGDPLGALRTEINELADALQQNRLAGTENNFLIRNLIDKLEMPALVLDESHALAMANPAFSRLYGRPPSELAGARTEALGLKETLANPSAPTHWINFPTRSSRYLVHSTEFRQGGRERTLYLFTDLKNPLREEERAAWKKLIRVMGHELNNSLTPIISLTNSLKARIPSSGMNGENAADFGEALDIVSNRATHLGNFVQSYAQLAKLPEPRGENFSLAKLVGAVTNLEGRARIEMADGPDCTVHADPAQIENLLINLVKNAFEAMGEKGRVHIFWKRRATEVAVYVDDEGPGIAGTENLFVPFFSTKPNGNGIGLIFCREIAEANGGSIDLANRPEGGCRATVVLPVGTGAVSD